jgi:hypothetical protein
MTPLTYILSRQRRWAERSNKSAVRDYFDTVGNNLFEPLAADATDEFNRADGNELGSLGGSPAKMLALRSSSALAVNVFHYWRTRDLSVLAKVLRIPSSGLASLEFERLTPIAKNVNRRIFPRDPNIDVVLRYDRGGIREIGIESKFAEAYGSHIGIKRAYLDEDSLWQGIPHVRRFAEMNCAPKRTVGVDYAQLIKHILGLKHRNGSVAKFRLLYLWYAVPMAVTALHVEQLSDFQALLRSDGIRFDSMTYQEVIQRLALALGPEHRSYLAYLADRYF